jgi:ribosomal protein S18 acetylase RimI-like enzyme
MAHITYRIGNDLNPDELIELFKATSLGVRRPVDNRDAIVSMIRHANLIVTAWDGPLMIGLARSMTDFSFVAYMADLAVRESHQRLGIGRELIRLTRAELGPATQLVLLAAPAAVEYYPQLGFTQHPSAWTLGAHEQLL